MFGNKNLKTPRSNPKTIRPEDPKDSWKWAIRRELSGESKDDRPYDNKTYSATVLYTSFVSEKKFKQKYDETFVEYVLNSRKFSSEENRIIVEAIVWVPEYCSCLPTIPSSDALNFFTFLKKQTPKGQKEGFDSLKVKSEDFKGKDSAENYLKKIRRFPKVYGIFGSEKTVDISIGSNIEVTFPYSYDIYAGAMA
jgi:hypothetical protein